MRTARLVVVVVGASLVAASSIACDRITAVGSAIAFDAAPDARASSDGASLPDEEGEPGERPPPIVPEPLAAPGLEVDGVACEVTRTTLLPSYFWYATVEGQCPMPIGNVRLLMNGRRDEPYPTFCSESNQANLYVYGADAPADAGDMDAGPSDAGDGFALYRSGSDDPPCAFLSAPDRFDDAAPVVFTGTALAASYPYVPGKTIAVAYRAP